MIDSDINDTDEAKGEPDVTVNGKILRMVQAVDGNWYGYFADRIMAQIADSTSTPNSQVGLDFGQFCSGTSAATILTGNNSGTCASGLAWLTPWAVEQVQMLPAPSVEVSQIRICSTR